MGTQLCAADLWDSHRAEQGLKPDPGAMVTQSSNCGHSGWPSNKPSVDVLRARVSGWKSAIFSPVPVSRVLRFSSHLFQNLL